MVRSTRHVAVVYGTRPEAIKVAPLVHALQASGAFEVSAIISGQHRDILDQVNEVFALKPLTNLEVCGTGQGIHEIVSRTMSRLAPVLTRISPDAVVVHGDTSTALAAAQTAFFLQMPVVHLEAGLRTHDLASPFPEEANRQLISRIASLHLAPTLANRDALVAEGIPSHCIAITGNTVIDALQQIRARSADTVLRRRRVLVTLHRRENLGSRMCSIAQAIRRVARKVEGVEVVFPMHPNPAVRAQLMPILDGLQNVTITGPLSYPRFLEELQRCAIVVTDSGGLQEEAPALGKPVLIVRDTTERPEAVMAGTARLVGTEEEAVFASLTDLLNNEDAYSRMANATNPFGDGQAALRCLAAIAELLGDGERLPDFYAFSSPRVAG